MMVQPEFRPVMMQLMNAINAVEGVERKNGAPPRNPNVRAVVKQLVAMGEFEPPGKSDTMEA